LRILIVSSNSAGLVLDARVLDIALRHHAEMMGVPLEVQQLRLPWQFYYRDEPVRFDRLKIIDRPDAIIFLENIVESDPPIDPAIPRILVPNLEWATARTERLLETIDQVWHKSRFSQTRLAAGMPKAQHHHLGFTSIDPGIKVQSYRSFAHFRGKSITRHSREILAVWRRNPRFPELKYQFYQDGPDTFEFGEWLSWKNVTVRAGKLADDEYFQVLSAHGIHLCTSASEGFGHYINEARAMAAVPVVLDAAPMNELIDSDCGVLLKPSGERPVKLGTHYQLSEAELERGVGAVLALSASDLEALGHNARRRFLAARERFLERMGPLFETLVRLAA
jgi:hypothetical protein